MAAHAFTYTEALDGENRSRATCNTQLGSVCTHACPRHSPDWYADYMARHASNVHGTGSIR